MIRRDFMVKGDKNYESSDEERRTYPHGRPSAPVTPRMLIRALKRLRKANFRRLVFNPREVTFEILRTYPAVQQDPHVLYLEVSDKLACAAAAGLVGNKQDVGYFAFDLAREGVRAASRSELMFWIYYRKLLKQIKKRRFERELNSHSYSLAKKGKARKTVRMMSFTDDHFHFLPLMQYRRKIIKNC